MMTCEEVRERLPEYALGTLDDTTDMAVRRHLRGCAACRREMTALSEGVSLFAMAVHDRTPPEELKGRVTTALAEEWTDAQQSQAAARPRRSWIAAVAAAAVLVAALSWGAVEMRHASTVSAQASSYQNLLSKLGGKEFRVGSLQPAPGRTVDGTVVAYDSSHYQSFVAVFLRAPGVSGDAKAVLTSPDGRSITVTPVKIGDDGSGAAWLVTPTDIQSFDHVVVTAPDGSTLATANISKA
jgi:hypothetical protein